MSLSTHDIMLTWVSLVHAGSYLPGALSQHLQDELGISLAEQDLLNSLVHKQMFVRRCVCLAIFGTCAATETQTYKIDQIEIIAVSAAV